MSLLDAVVEQKIECKIPGCKKTWTLQAEEIVNSWSQSNYRLPKRMCPSCKETIAQLQPLNIKCGTKNCKESKPIKPYQQLVLLRKGRSLEDEFFFCETCQQLAKKIGAEEIPCRIKACSNTWLWFATSRLKTSGRELKSPPEPRLCNSCFKLFQTLSSQRRPCRINACNNEWILDRMTQLESKIRGKKEPTRICPSCNLLLKQLTQKEQPCQVSGCKNTWLWSPYSQLEYERNREVDPSRAPPQRYCNSCYHFLKKGSPFEIPCHKKSCPNMITYSVELQLEDTVQKKKPDRHQLLCSACKKLIEFKLQKKEIPCKQEGCHRIRTWTQDEQFETGFYKGDQFVIGTPPSQYCEHCHDFLLTRPDTYVNCSQCEDPILWTTRQQLMSEVGLWVVPKLCPACLKVS